MPTEYQTVPVADPDAEAHARRAAWLRSHPAWKIFSVGLYPADRRWHAERGDARTDRGQDTHVRRDLGELIDYLESYY